MWRSEITFTPGLSAGEKGSVFENEPIKDETSAQRYIRKEKERKARRREKAKAAREEENPDTVAEEEQHGEESGKEDLGFDDPFFGDEKTKKKKHPRPHVKKSDARSAKPNRQKPSLAASNKASLELLMEDENATAQDGQDHFNIAEIARAEKRSRKKGKKRQG